MSRLIQFRTGIAACPSTTRRTIRFEPDDYRMMVLADPPPRWRLRIRGRLRLRYWLRRALGSARTPQQFRTGYRLAWAVSRGWGHP